MDFGDFCQEIADRYNKLEREALKEGREPNDLLLLSPNEDEGAVN